MASSKRVQITVEFPEELAKLSKEEADRLKGIFKTEAANILSGKVRESLLTTVIRNTKPGGGGGSPLAGVSRGAAKKSSKKAAKKSAKKSRKRG